MPTQTSGPEPWRLDPLDAHVVYDDAGEVAAVTLSKENARRLISAVNAVAGIGNDELDSGIVQRGLECLRDICRYHHEETFRARIDSRNGAFDQLVGCGREIWTQLGAYRSGSS